MKPTLSVIFTPASFSAAVCGAVSSELTHTPSAPAPGSGGPLGM